MRVQLRSSHPGTCLLKHDIKYVVIGESYDNPELDDDMYFIVVTSDDGRQALLDYPQSWFIKLED